MSWLLGNGAAADYEVALAVTQRHQRRVWFDVRFEICYWRAGADSQGPRGVGSLVLPMLPWPSQLRRFFVRGLAFLCWTEVYSLGDAIFSSRKFRSRGGSRALEVRRGRVESGVNTRALATEREKCGPAPSERATPPAVGPCFRCITLFHVALISPKSNGASS